jgi:hypothetical protein
MSISQPKLTNPCQKFLEYSGDSGQFYYYDKEKEVKVEIPLPIYFVCLDELSTISGFNEKHGCGIFSNEVHSTVNEILRVRTFKGGVSIVGKYKEISDEVKAAGGKFTKSVYAMLVGGKDVKPELVNFKFKGSAFNGWLDKKFSPYEYVTGIVGLEEATKGKTKYQIPVFKPFKLADALLDKAREYDVILQAYLTEYKAQIPETITAKAETQEEDNTPPQGNQQWKKENLKREDIGGSLTPIDDVAEPPFWDNFSVG